MISMEVPVKKISGYSRYNEVRLKGGYLTKMPIKELLCTYDPETKSGTEGAEGKGHSCRGLQQ